DDDQDREGDQADEPEQRSQVRRRAGRPLRSARAAARNQPLRAGGGLLRRRLVLEEVEVDVGVVLGHGASGFCRKKSARSTGFIGRGRTLSGSAKTKGIVAEAALALSSSALVAERYRPLRPLGSGGSGSVWLARDERNGLDVALKIVPREGKAASRAEREAEAAARLRHPGCQRAYGFGRDSQHVYIAYEYVPGRTFREAMRSGELDDASAIEAAIQILDVLAHAHAHGIVHRDVKPSNVLLAEGERVSVRVLDFGLAQIQEAETLTAQGDVPGT